MSGRDIETPLVRPSLSWEDVRPGERPGRTPPGSRLPKLAINLNFRLFSFGF